MKAMRDSYLRVALLVLPFMSLSAYATPSSPQSNVSRWQDLMTSQTLYYAMALSTPGSNRTTALARCSEVYSEIRSTSLDASTGTTSRVITGGAWDIVHFLSGDSIQNRIETDLRARNEDPRAMSHEPSPQLRGLRVGQLWLIVYESARPPGYRVNYLSVPLTGPDDPILKAIRDHQRWMMAPASAGNAGAARHRALDISESFTSRYGALLSLQLMRRARPNSAAHSASLRAAGDLLLQPDCPTVLVCTALEAVKFDARKGIAEKSDAALVVRALAHALKSSHDSDVLSRVSDVLAGVATQHDNAPPYTVYYYPEIVRLLESRAEGDRQHGMETSWVEPSLMNLDLAHRRNRSQFQETPVVVLRLPKGLLDQ